MSGPTLYHVDHHGAFNGEMSLARPSPGDAALGKTVWLIPEGATIEAPPPAGPGKVAVLERGQWAVVEDHRGQVAYDTTTRAAHIVETPGPIGTGKTLQAPSSPDDTWSGSAWELLRENVPVPAAVTPAQIRLALAEIDMLAAVEGMVDRLGSTARIRWDFGVVIPRNDPLVLAAAEQLEWSGAQVDDLFRAAVQF